MLNYLLIIVLLSVNVFGFDFSQNEDSEGVFGKLKSGLKLAGKILGFDAASEVAKLVTESFMKPSRKGDTAQGSTNIFSGFFRLIGLQTSKVGAIAVNALIFLAQLISTSLSRPAPPELVHARKIPPGTPFEWLVNNPNINDLLTAAKNPELPDHVVDYLKERTSDEETGCIQLLICKTAPFLWGMQKAITSNAVFNNESLVSRMFHFLPTTEEVAHHGDQCEVKFPTCFLDSA